MTPKDIHPRSTVAALPRDFSREELHRSFDSDLICALVGMNATFVRRVLGRGGGALSLADVLCLLDQDAFHETFVPRSRIPAYLLSHGSSRMARMARPWPTTRSAIINGHYLVQGSASALVPKLGEESIQCIVTSTPYWGTRLYDDHHCDRWADGEECSFGHEQTPEGFIRHTVEILFCLKRVLSRDGSIWWNLMDVYNTRTQIRASAAETLNAMRGNDSRGWSDFRCRRYSAGHAFLKDGEQCGIPGRVAARLSRIGYYIKSLISWKKSGSLPESVASRVTRELEYIIHVSKTRTPRFHKRRFRTLPATIGGRNAKYETEKLTDVWHFPTATGQDGHGAQFPVALPARCIALSTDPDDVVLDPFTGSGTTSVAAVLAQRRSVGFDVSGSYLRVAKHRLVQAKRRADALALGRSTPALRFPTPGGRSSAFDQAQPARRQSSSMATRR